MNFSNWPARRGEKNEEFRTENELLSENKLNESLFDSMWDFRCELIRSNARLISDRNRESETDTERADKEELGDNCGNETFRLAESDGRTQSTMSIIGVRGRMYGYRY